MTITLLQLIMFSLSMLSVSIMFYWLGIHNERTAWNDLISQGKIPKPTKRGG